MSTPPQVGPRTVLVTWVDFPGDDSPQVHRLREVGLELRRAPRLGERSVEEMIRLARGCEAAIVSTDPFPREFFEAVPEMRVISRVGVGSDAIDLLAAEQHGVAVTIARGTNEEAVADHTIGLMLSVLRKIPAMDASVRHEEWHRVDPWLGNDLHGKTVGLLGLGRIARLVIDRLRGFGVETIGYDPYSSPPPGVRAADLHEVISGADILSLHLPLTPETRGCIGRDEIALMRPGAVLINTARGGVVDEDALAEALREGRIAGAGLDVFGVEPPVRSPLLGLTRSTVLTPHIGGLSREAIVDMVAHATDAVVDVMSGRKPRDVVNNPHPAPWEAGVLSPAESGAYSERNER
ncbi:phosphoglycerate dehydrogenase [Microbacterium sp. NPDC058342]|uniref:phosphoglycerate dehydrogenase n=1 Tax=Microbacterium sp. NPDC058342 TaxID=3346454 RepID=UPI00364D011E